jgi:hypothetical protein
MSMPMLHIHVNAERPCQFCMSISMLHVHVNAACPCRCSMIISMLHVSVRAACSWPWLHVHVRAACLWPCCMSMSLHVLDAFLFIVHYPYPCPCCMSTLYFFIACHDVCLQYNACPHCMSILHANAARPCCMPMEHVHAPCSCIHAACPCCMSMLLSNLRDHVACPVFAATLDAGYHTCTAISDKGA